MILECIFYAEFDNTLGPTVVYQTPGSFPAPSVLESVSDYVICPPLLCGKVMTVTSTDAATGDKYKVVGYPQYISGSKYPRNKLSFNMCFVFCQDTHTRPWCAAVRKVAEMLRAVELESEFLFRPELKCRLPGILRRMRADLNSRASCSIRIDDANVLNVKLFPLLPPPPRVNDFDVPVRVSKLDAMVTREWDLTMQHIIPLIDGIRYVKLIALEAKVETEMVKACVRQLLFYNCVVLIDIFLYSNVYAATPRISEFLGSEEMQQQCQAYVTRQGRKPATPKRLFELYAALKPGTRLSNFCQRYHRRVQEANIDDRRFITFGLVHGLLRRVHEYAVNRGLAGATEAEQQILKQRAAMLGMVGGDPGMMNGAGDGSAGIEGLSERDPGINRIMPLLDGVRHVDDICTATMRSHAELSMVFKAQPKVSVVFK